MNAPQNALASLLAPLQAAAQAVRVESLTIPGFVDQVDARLYRPLGSGPHPVVLYFHGGGFVGGTLDDAEVPARHIARAANVAVLSVAYSLAPARPFPAAPEDAHAAARWLLANGKRLNLDARSLAVAGDDAGGNIAAALALMARDRNGPSIAAQVLIGPMLDPSMTKLGDAVRLGSDLKPETCAACYSKYLPRLLQRLHPYASPLESRRLHGLPPTLLLTAECDVLHKEAEQYASALMTAGVPIQITRFPVRHAELPEHDALLAEAADFLRRHLSPSPSDIDPARKKS